MSELQETVEEARQSGRTEAPRVQTVEGHRTNVAAWQILVADDDAGSGELSEDILSTGYRVVTAEDGQAAWELIQTNPLNLVLSDLSKPRMDGMGLLRAVGGRGRAALRLNKRLWREMHGDLKPLEALKHALEESRKLRYVSEAPTAPWRTPKEVDEAGATVRTSPSGPSTGPGVWPSG